MTAELPIDQQTSVETLVHRIYQRIADQPIDESYSLLGGQVGYALFESYYQRQFGLNDTSRIWERLEASINAIGDGKVGYSFAEGMAGIAWGFLHLANHGFLADSADDPQESVAALDEPLFLLSMEDMHTGNFDYLHGGLGACLYFLERRRTPEIRVYLTQLIDQLDDISFKNNRGEISWLFPNFGERRPDDPVDYNLSLSHGTASIVAVLCLLYQRGYARPQCAYLIEGALHWMWNNRNKENIAVFPNRVLDRPQDEFSRLAWCYGDLGIANTFWLAGETLRNTHWKQMAEYTLRKAATRREQSETSITEPGFCHGSAGVAHLFSRYVHRYQAPSIEQASLHWIADTLSRMAAQEDGATLRKYPHQNNSAALDLSLLEGEAGIGMMFLTHLGASSAWERALLLQ